jgi:hypothetical protein
MPLLCEKLDMLQRHVTRHSLIINAVTSLEERLMNMLESMNIADEVLEEFEAILEESK